MRQSAAVALVVKNEAQDLPEWIDHYHRIGFEKIHIYDDGSDDGTTRVLSRLAQTYPVIWHEWFPDAQQLAGRTRQVAAYGDACQRLSGETDWVFFADCDEFLLPPSPQKSISDLLERHQAHSSFALNWKIFGSEGLQQTAGQLVLSAFTRRAPYDFGPNQHVKMFCRPEKVTDVLNPHYAETREPVYAIDGSVIAWQLPGVTAPGSVVEGDWQLNHYMTRSREHWQRRIARRQVDGSSRDWKLFADYDRNDIVDRKGVKWAVMVRESLRQIGVERSVGPITMAEPAVVAAIATEQKLLSDGA